MAAAEQLLGARVALTAIFAGNDQMAYRAGLALFRRGMRVRRDVSTPSSAHRPHARVRPLTSRFVNGYLDSGIEEYAESGSS